MTATHKTWDELSPLARSFDPYDVSEEFAGYIVGLEHIEASDAEIIEAAREHDLHSVGEEIGGAYNVKRGFGIYEALEGMDEEMVKIVFEPDPREGLKPMVLVQWEEEAGGL